MYLGGPSEFWASGIRRPSFYHSALDGNARAALLPWFVATWFAVWNAAISWAIGTHFVNTSNGQARFDYHVFELTACSAPPRVYDGAMTPRLSALNFRCCNATVLLQGGFVLSLPDYLSGTT